MAQPTTQHTYFKVKIEKASKLTFGNKREDVWYNNKVGDTILVREVTWDSPFYQAKNGNSVLKADVTKVTSN